MNMRDQEGEVGTVAALLLAVHGGCDEEVERLLAAGVDVNSADEDGLTPLMAAAMNGSFVMTRKLLDAGADCCKRNKWEMTARDIALFHGYTALALLLTNWIHAVEPDKQNVVPDCSAPGHELAR